MVASSCLPVRVLRASTVADPGRRRARVGPWLWPWSASGEAGPTLALPVSTGPPRPTRARTRANYWRDMHPEPPRV